TIRVRKDGSLIDISLTISPVRNSDGIIIGASKIARNISEGKRLIAELRHANGMLEQFAYSATHDLLEPLRMVKIYGQLLLRKYGDRLDDEGLRLLEEVQNGATRVGTMVTDLHSYTRLIQFEKSTKPFDADIALH